MNILRRLALILLVLPAVAAGAAPAPEGPAPTLANVRYGPHARNLLDFWRAPSKGLAPVVVYIHGGGFVMGDKEGARHEVLLSRCLAAGVSFVAIDYRYLSPSAPMPQVLRDCARAVQFVRWRAAAWNVDRGRIAAYGQSAGAGASLWLAFHGDLAERGAHDPVARQSTLIACAGAIAPQFSYDPLQWEELFGADVVRKFGAQYQDPALFGFPTAAAMRSPAGRRTLADCDMAGLVAPGAPPVFLVATNRSVALSGVNQLLHHPMHARVIYDRCREEGVTVVGVIPAYGISPPPEGPATLERFLFRYLKVR